MKPTLAGAQAPEGLLVKKSLVELPAGNIVFHMFFLASVGSTT